MKEFYIVLIVVLLPLQWTFFFRRGIVLFHLVNILFLAFFWASFLIQKRPIRWPLLLPMWLILTGSLLGMFHSESLGLNVYTLSQDLYLYLWFIALCMLLVKERDYRMLVVAWTLAALLIAATGFEDLASIGQVRSEFTFRNPNRAATYFMVSFFFTLTPVFRRLGVLRIAPSLILLGAALATGSLGIVMASLTGMAVFLLALVYIRNKHRSWLPRQLLILAVFGALVAYLAPSYFEQRGEGFLTRSLPMIFGRAPRSFGGRTAIWQLGLSTFVRTPFGIGPFSFYGQVQTNLGETGRIELHSDFVAYLVERGIIGFTGLIVLILTVARRLYRQIGELTALGHPEPAIWMAALAGGAAAYLSYGIGHEALHHDTLWLLLAMAMAPVTMVRQETSSEGRRATAISPISSPNTHGSSELLSGKP